MGTSLGWFKKIATRIHVDQIIESFAQKKEDYKAIIGLVDSEPCIALVDVNLLNDSSPDINLFYDNLMFI